MPTTSDLIRQRQYRGGTPRTPRTPASPLTAVMRHPNDVNTTYQMQRSVNQLNECFRPTNTARAHEPKIEEFFQFCDMVYPTDSYKYNICFEKVYRFMYYQAFRPLKKRGGGGGRKRKRTTRATPNKVYDDDGETVVEEIMEEEEQERTMRFDKELYDEVMAQYNGSPPNSPGGETELPLQSMQQPLSWSSFDQYKQVIRRIYKVQKQERVCSLDWDGIWQESLEELAKQVKGRKHHIKKITYQEKVSAEFAPYTIVERYQDIEEEFWKDSCKAVGPRQIACQLRHRYCIQHTSSGILRCESLHRAEFSDFITIKVPKTDTDVHPVEIMVNQIAQGKTNKGRLIYGRAIRHRDVRLCCVSALSFYLQYRFYVTNEFKDMTVDDWFDNKKWFDIKLLCDVYGDNKKEMAKDTYGSHVKVVLQRLGIPFNKRLHIGRNIGAKCLELLEEEQEAIKQMGQWNQAMFDIAYSAKLPMGPMRKLAGFHGGHKMYFNTRTIVQPTDELLRMTPLGSWIYDTWEAVVADGRAPDHPTAMYTLRFFMTMNLVLLQDAAAMTILHPERAAHPLFQNLPVFQSDQFVAFMEEMKKSMTDEESPLDANLEKVLPGIHQWHRINQQEVTQLKSSIREMHEKVNERLDHLVSVVEDGKEDTKRQLVNTFLSVADSLLHGASASNIRRAVVGAERASTSVTDEYTATTNTPNTMDDRDPSDVHSTYRMKPKHDCLLHMVNEWFGLEDFKDEYGGIDGRIKMYKSTTKWRKKCHIHQMHFSRTQRSIKAIETHAGINTTTIEEAATDLQGVWEECGRSVSNFVKWSQETGLVETKAKRGKFAKANVVVVVTQDNVQ